MNQICDDFLAESRALAAILTDLPDAEFRTVTSFQAWTIDDVLVHLHLWNGLVQLALTEPDRFRDFLAKFMPLPLPVQRRALENDSVKERGQSLLRAWRDGFERLAKAWRSLDPKQRMIWAGPDMSVRTALTARLMETWAHGQEVFDVLGLARQERDTVRNVAIIGAQTFKWSFIVRGLTPPSSMPAVHLSLPSGAPLELGGDPASGLIEGSAVEFAQVVAQTRNIDDTSLRVTGDVARRWMEIAQAFAGQPATPPARGTRFRVIRAEGRGSSGR